MREWYDLNLQDRFVRVTVISGVLLDRGELSGEREHSYTIYNERQRGSSIEPLSIHFVFFFAKVQHGVSYAICCLYAAVMPA